jgi:hypothetical protein
LDLHTSDLDVLDVELGLGLVAIDCDVVNSVSLQCSEDIRHSYFSLSREVRLYILEPQ